MIDTPFKVCSQPKEQKNGKCGHVGNRVVLGELDSYPKKKELDSFCSLYLIERWLSGDQSGFVFLEKNK
jgi:hypothetical protein